MPGDTLNIGVVGCGGFARFAVGHFAQVLGIKIVALADPYDEAYELLASQFPDLPNDKDIKTLAARPEVDLIYIATPPYLHYEQSLAALRAGKHVICEKPMALTLDQADEMAHEANARGLLMVANLMQRYNPLYSAIEQLTASRVLGEPLHGYFENYASDQFLPPEHWFWNPARSGRIFIEHGVHFFDMFEGWLGRGYVEAAQAATRPGADHMEDQVQCTVRYGDSVLVNFYHGFHQPKIMDRQEMRLVFERGDVRLYGWVPTRVEIEALLDDHLARHLQDIFPQASVQVLDRFEGNGSRFEGRHKQFHATQHLRLKAGGDVEKEDLYGEILKAMLRDQWAWIRNHHHERRITEANGYDSLAMAMEADRLAHQHVATVYHV